MLAKGQGQGQSHTKVKFKTWVKAVMRLGSLSDQMFASATITCHNMTIGIDRGTKSSFPPSIITRISISYLFKVIIKVKVV